MYELLYMSMLMDDQLIDEPCPKATATDEEKSTFVDKYFELVTQNYEVRKASETIEKPYLIYICTFQTWSKLLYRAGGTEEEVLAKLLGKHAVRGKGRRSKENDQ